MSAIRDVIKGLDNLPKNVQDTLNVSISEDTQSEAAEVSEKSFEGAVDTKALAGQLGIDESYIIDDLHMTNLEKEKNPYLKTDLSDQKTISKNDKGDRIDKLSDGDSVDIADGTLSKNENGTVHVESEYLGTFDYDPDMFCYGYKEVAEKDGSVGQLPVLEYIGDSNGQWGWDFLGTRAADFDLPDGIKSCDYMFANNETIEYAPRMPDSVETAHCMYANAKNLDGHTRAAKDGENVLTNGGGSVHLSENLKDMSGMYKGCENMESDFGTLPESVVNITEAWEGCEGMGSTDDFWSGGHTYSIPEYGSVATPYLTSVYAKNALNDISNEKVKEQADDADYVIDEDGSVADKHKDFVESGKSDGTLDEESLSESQAATGLDYQEDIYNGTVDSEVELASNGARSDNKVYNAATGKYEYDATGELQSDDKNVNSWQRYVIDGVAGLAIGGIAGKVTGSKLVGLAAGVGGAYLLDKSDILPKSFAPILSGTADLLPDGAAKDKLNEWAKELSGSEVDNQKAELTPDNVANMHQEDRLLDSVKSANSVMVQDVSESMQNNGKMAATAMALWSTARKGEDSAKTVNEYVVSKCTSAMEDKWNSQEPNDELKAEMKSYYTKMFEALDSYNKGAKDGIESAFSSDETRKELSLYGLQMVNRSYTEGVMDSFVRMNEQYQFMSEAELSALQNNLKIDGIGDLTAYKDSSSFDELRSEASLEVDSLASVDVVNEDEDVYVPDYGTSKDSVQCTEEKEEQPVVKKSSENRMSRGEQAAAVTGFTGDENDNTMISDVEYD